jgi:hypothetical protein
MKLTHGKNTIPHPLRKSGKQAARKAQRRIEAELRQQLYSALTTSEKILRIRSRCGKSARELARLLAKEA